MKKLLQAAAMSLTFLSLAAPALAQVYVNVAPPAPIAETRPMSPGSGYVWIAGHYKWNGYRYVWVNGHYAYRHCTGGYWVAGQWVQGPHGRWHYKDGHWHC